MADTHLLSALISLASGDVDAARFKLPELHRLGWAQHCADGEWRVTTAGKWVIQKFRELAEEPRRTEGAEL